jgi:hypothetical protein
MLNERHNILSSSSTMPIYSTGAVAKKIGIFEHNAESMWHF